LYAISTPYTIHIQHAACKTHRIPVLVEEISCKSPQRGGVVSSQQQGGTPYGTVQQSAIDQQLHSTQVPVVGCPTSSSAPTMSYSARPCRRYSVPFPSSRRHTSTSTCLARSSTPSSPSRRRSTSSTSPTPTPRGLLPLQARDSPRRPREATGASVLLSLLAVPRIYPKSPLSLLAVAARVGVYPKSRLSLLELGLTAPPKPVSLRDAGVATPEVALGCGFSSARVCVAL